MSTFNEESVKKQRGAALQAKSLEELLPETPMSQSILEEMMLEQLMVEQEGSTIH
jgi:hypothetical protein